MRGGASLCVFAKGYHESVRLGAYAAPMTLHNRRYNMPNRPALDA